MIILFWLFRDMAFAATDPAGGATVPTTDKNAVTAVDWLNMIIGAMNFLISPLIMLAWWLLSPDWIFWDVFNLRPVFHKLWIYVSNVVYVVFALVLVYIAIINIFYENKKTFELKSALPRLIISILMVPFSWFIVSWVLSITTVLTAEVIRIPMSTISEIWGKDFLEKPVVPKWVYYDKTKWAQTEDKAAWAKDTTAAAWPFSSWDCAKGECWTIKQMIESKWWAYNLLSIFAYWIFQVDKTQQISDQQKKSLQNLWSLWEQLVSWAVFFLAFWFMVISIIVVLFTRVFRLWIIAIFSPFFAVAYFFKDWWDKKLKEHGLTIQSFISLALVPVYVSAALAFWLMFISAVRSSSPTDWECVKWEYAKICPEWEEIQIMTFWDEGQNWTIELIMEWKLDWEKSVAWVLSAWNWILSKVIINLLSIWVLWIAVKTALSADEITKKAFAPLEKLWDKFISEAPKYAPLPIPWWSIKWAQMVAWELERTRDTQVSADVGNSRFLKRFKPDTDNIGHMSKLREIWAKWTAIWDEQMREMQKEVKAIIAKSWSASPDAQEAVRKYYEYMQATGKASHWDFKELTKVGSTLTADQVWWLMVNNIRDNVKENSAHNRTLASDWTTPWKATTDTKENNWRISEDDVKEENAESKKLWVHYSISVSWKRLELDADRKLVNAKAERQDLISIFKNSWAKNEVELAEAIKAKFQDIDPTWKLTKQIVDEIWKEPLLIKTMTAEEKKIAETKSAEAEALAIAKKKADESSTTKPGWTPPPAWPAS